MKIKLSLLRKLIREAIYREEAWVSEQNLGDNEEEVEDLDEVDTDPSNNPGRPADPYEYLGMHPSPTAAMSHPSAGGSSGATPGDAGASEDLAEMKLFHGSPFSGVDDKFGSYDAGSRGVLFFTPDHHTAREYALMDPKYTRVLAAARPVRDDVKREPTIYTADVHPSRIFDTHVSSMLDEYEEIRQEVRQQYPNDPEEWFPKALNKHGTGALSPRGYLNWGSVHLKTYLMNRGYDAMWIDEGSQGVSLAMFDWAGKVSVIKRERVVK